MFLRARKSYVYALLLGARLGTLDLGWGATLVGSSVDLDYGTFNGVADNATGIVYFRGVRYADPPLGNLRWRAPVSPPSTHLGNVNASSFGNACISTTQTAVSAGTSEDCLFGNVYIPIDTQVDDRLPVMVWFHGGGFQGGDTHDAPPELIMHSSVNPLIFVSFEYRLGQFGFLGGSEIGRNGSLNAGLLDQRGALKWVQRYIHLWGGDKTKVTIWGESAGAGSTMFHLMADGGDTGGLFRAAMGDSPSLSFMPLFSQSYDEDIFTQFAELAGCASPDTGTALACLRATSSNTLTVAGSQQLALRPATIFVFAPVLDASFLTRRPVEVFSMGTFARVPTLFGTNTNEGAQWSAGLADPTANTSTPGADENTVFNFLQGQWASLPRASYNAMLELYPLDDYNGSFSLQGQQMYGEARYICTAGMVTGASTDIGEKAYRFHYDNPHLGSNHGAELDAFFSPPSDASSDDLALFSAMREYWTSFVTTGVPAAAGGAEWKPVTTEQGSPWMLLQPGNIEVQAVPQSLENRCMRWQSLSGEMQT